MSAIRIRQGITPPIFTKIPMGKKDAGQ